jgi:hypothetical protein
MADQLQGLVQKMQAEGVPEADILAFVNQFDTENTPAPKETSTPTPKDYSQYGPMSQLYRDMDEREQNKQWVKDNAPAIGAGVVGLATGGAGVIPSAIAAAGGGFLGARLRGDSRADAAVSGGLQGALTAGTGVIGAGVVRAGQAVADRAVPLVRSALKPAFSELRRRAGIEGVAPAALANRQAKFIVDHQLSTPEQAAALAKVSGQQVDDAIAAAEANPTVSPVLDTANRIPRYLNAMLKRVEKQITPGKDRAAIQNLGREVVEDSPLSQNVGSTTPKQPPPASINRPSLTQPSLNRPWGTPKVEPSSRPRALRANVKPSEGAEIVRSKSFFDKDASGGSIAGGKAIERAIRDSIKETVPATRQPLMTQGRAMDAERLLDRASWRDANRDSMPGGMGAIAGIANGRPLVGMLLQALKEGQLKAGLAAPRYGARLQGAGKMVSELDQLVRAAQISMLSGQQE